MLGSTETDFIAVFNPAATGAAGQNALYVLSGQGTEHAKIYIFDIDATTGALTPAGEVLIPGIRFGEALAYSGDVLVVDGAAAEGQGFQRAVINSNGEPEFESLPDAPCPGLSCDDGHIYMLDTEHMLSDNLVLNPNSKVPEEYVSGVSAYEVGGSWSNIASSVSQRPAGLITANSHEYLVIEQQSEYEALQEGEPFTGEVLLETFAVNGGSEGYTKLGSETVDHPDGVFSLGSGLYVANSTEVNSFATGYAYRLSTSQPPVSTELNSALGGAMTGFLSSGGGSEEIGPGGPGPGGSGTETPASFGLTVTASGSGEVAGTGIACPSTCSASYAAGTAVTLTASPAPGSTFAGWGGACTGSGACVVTMSAARTVAATFATIPPPSTTIISAKTSGSKVAIKFKGSGGYGALTFRCKLGPAKKSTMCHSPAIHSKLGPGKHHFSVYAVDSRGVADPTPAGINFTTK